MHYNSIKHTHNIEKQRKLAKKNNIAYNLKHFSVNLSVGKELEKRNTIIIAEWTCGVCNTEPLICRAVFANLMYKSPILFTCMKDFKL